MPDQSMAERVSPPRVDKPNKKTMVISMREYKRREAVKKLGKGILAFAANRAIQAVTGVSVIGAAGKLAYDNYVAEENQAEKMAKFPAKRLFVGKATFKVSDSMNLRTEPINEPQDANAINTVLKMGGKNVKQGDKVVVENPLGIDIETRSGVKTTWLQIPNLERRNLGLRNSIVGYAPFNNGNEAYGSFHEIMEVKDGFYRLKGHDPIPVNQTQVFKVNGK